MVSMASAARLVRPTQERQTRPQLARSFAERKENQWIFTSSGTHVAAGAAAAAEEEPEAIAGARAEGGAESGAAAAARVLEEWMAARVVGNCSKNTHEHTGPSRRTL